jgi:hypothetical protein
MQASGRDSIQRTLLVRRLKLFMIASLLVLALAWWMDMIQSQAGGSRPWIEVYARPRTICYQGPPLRERVLVQLWPGGPGFRLTQERKIDLTPIIEEAVP